MIPDNEIADDDWAQIIPDDELANEPELVFRRKTVMAFYEYENRIQYLEDMVEELRDMIIQLQRNA